MSENSSLGIGTAIVIAVVLVGFGMVITSRAPSAKLAATPDANLVSMEQNGQEMVDYTGRLRRSLGLP